MRKTIYAILTAVVTIFAVGSQSVYADRHDYDQEEYDLAKLMELVLDMRNSRVLDVPRDVRDKEVPKFSVITINKQGAHLPLGQNILFVGPVNDDYYLFPFDSGSGANPHKWLSGAYHAKYFGESEGLKIFTLQVKVKDPVQHSHFLGTPHNYVMIFEVTDANGPKEVSFSSPVHPGTGGSHGGGAHGNR